MSTEPKRRKLYQALPGMLLKPLSFAPFALQREAISRAVYRVLADALAAGDCAPLRGKCLEIRLEDLKISRFFALDAHDKIHVTAHGMADVVIRGDVNTFILLASRKEDPDTLFFQRRLMIEGDTELGLTVKNLLDRLEMNSLPLEMQFLLRSAGEFVALVS